MIDKRISTYRSGLIAFAVMALIGCSNSADSSADGSAPTSDGPLRTCGTPRALHRDTLQFWAMFPGCERLLGDVDLTFSTRGSLAPLSSLREIEGFFFLLENPLDSLTGLERLERVYGNFQLRGLPLTNLGELRSLREIRGELFIMSNPRLTSLTGLQSLESVGALLIMANPELTSLDGLSGLRRVEGDVRIIENARLTDEQIAAFVARIEVGGEVILESEL